MVQRRQSQYPAPVGTIPAKSAPEDNPTCPHLTEEIHMTQDPNEELLQEARQVIRRKHLA